MVCTWLFNFWNSFSKKWKVLVRDGRFIISFIVGIILFAGGQTFLMFVCQYNDTFPTTAVGDLILDNIPTYNLNFLFTWGLAAIMLVIVFYCIFVRPELLPWSLKTYGIFAIVRAGFIVLTHIGSPSDMFYFVNPHITQNVTFQQIFFLNDLFFSGHVGNPFLAFLIFRHFKFKWFCLIGSILMAITVLFMHVHYSIDVFGAYFVTYGIYAFSDSIFHGLNERFKKLIEGHSDIRFKPSYSPESLKGD
jgi:membrane-associated phospholipid phosphatase